MNRITNELLFPFWEGTKAINESILPLKEKDGSIKPISLLYKPDTILSVRSASLEKTYEEGKDYVLTTDGLVIPEGSSIFAFDYADYYPEADDGHTFPHTDGGFIRFSEGPYMHDRQTVVTYTHSDSYTGTIPCSKAALLPKTMKQLSEKKDIRLLIFGDSISTGCNASGWYKVAPFQKPWFNCLKEGIDTAYGTDITLLNTAVGGTVSKWGLETAVERGADQKPDLCVLAFGMNDGSGRVPAEEYIAHITGIMDIISKANPACEYILIATTIANKEVKGFLGNQKDYLAPLTALEKEGVCVADMTTVHCDLLARKAFRDMTGNNVNHPNDFLSRVYAQVMLRTMGLI